MVREREVKIRLGIIKTVIEVWTFPLNHIREVFRLIWLPLLAVPAIKLAVYGFTVILPFDFLSEIIRAWPDQSPASDPILVLAIGSFNEAVFLAILCWFLTPLVLAWHEIVLGTATRLVAWRGLAFGKMELRIFLLLVCFIILYWQLLAYPAQMLFNQFVTIANDTRVQDSSGISAEIAPVIGLFAYLMVLRMSLLLPCAANGETPSLRRAWSLAARNGSRFLVITLSAAIILWVMGIVIEISVAYGTRLLLMAYPTFVSVLYELPKSGFLAITFYSKEVLNTLADLLICIFAVTALSSCYRQLVGRKIEADIFE